MTAADKSVEMHDQYNIPLVASVDRTYMGWQRFPHKMGRSIAA